MVKSKGSAVVGRSERSERTLSGPGVVPDRCGEGEQELEHTSHHATRGSASMTFEVELGLERGIDRFDELAQGLRSGLVTRPLSLLWAGRTSSTPWPAKKDSNSADRYPLSARIRCPGGALPQRHRRDDAAARTRAHRRRATRRPVPPSGHRIEPRRLAGGHEPCPPVLHQLRPRLPPGRRPNAQTLQHRRDRPGPGARRPRGRSWLQGALRSPLLCAEVRIRRCGGAEGTRTPDPHTASVVRYQLRHSPGAHWAASA